MLVILRAPGPIRILASQVTVSPMEPRLDSTWENRFLVLHHHSTILSSSNASHMGCRLPRWLIGKESACQCRRRGSTRSPGEGNGSPLQYSCLGNPMNRGAWWTTIHGGHKRVRHDLVTVEQQ